MSPIIVIIFSEGRHLWALISQLLKGQIEKFWCLSYREFPEFFKNGPTFYSSSTQWPSVTIFHKWHFFLGHPVHIIYVMLLLLILNLVFWRNNVHLVPSTNRQKKKHDHKRFYIFYPLKVTFFTCYENMRDFGCESNPII